MSAGTIAAIALGAALLILILFVVACWKYGDQRYQAGKNAAELEDLRHELAQARKNTTASATARDEVKELDRRLAANPDDAVGLLWNHTPKADADGSGGDRPSGDAGTGEAVPGSSEA